MLVTIVEIENQADSDKPFIGFACSCGKEDADKDFLIPDENGGFLNKLRCAFFNYLRRVAA